MKRFAVRLLTLMMVLSVPITGGHIVKYPCRGRLSTRKS